MRRNELTSCAASARPPSTPPTMPDAASLAAGRMPLRKLRIASSWSLTQPLLPWSHAMALSAPSLISWPTPPRLPNSASAKTQVRPAATRTTPIMHAEMASPRGTPRRTAQPVRGTSCVLMRAATMSGTVAARAYQMAPPTSRTPAVMSRAFALQRAIWVPAAGRPGADTDMRSRFDGRMRQPCSGPAWTAGRAQSSAGGITTTGQVARCSNSCDVLPSAPRSGLNPRDPTTISSAPRVSATVAIAAPAWPPISSVSTLTPGKLRQGLEDLAAEVLVVGHRVRVRRAAEHRRRQVEGVDHKERAALTGALCAPGECGSCGRRTVVSDHDGARTITHARTLTTCVRPC